MAEATISITVKPVRGLLKRLYGVVSVGSLYDFPYVFWDGRWVYSGWGRYTHVFGLPAEPGEHVLEVMNARPVWTGARMRCVVRVVGVYDGVEMELLRTPTLSIPPREKVRYVIRVPRAIG